LLLGGGGGGGAVCDGGEGTVLFLFSAAQIGSLLFFFFLLEKSFFRSCLATEDTASVYIFLFSFFLVLMKFQNTNTTFFFSLCFNTDAHLHFSFRCDGWIRAKDWSSVSRGRSCCQRIHCEAGMLRFGKVSPLFNVRLSMLNRIIMKEKLSPEECWDISQIFCVCFMPLCCSSRVFQVAHLRNWNLRAVVWTSLVRIPGCVRQCKAGVSNSKTQWAEIKKLIRVKSQMGSTFIENVLKENVLHILNVELTRPIEYCL